MDVRQTHEQNRLAWNEGASKYREEIESDVEFLKNGGQNFCESELPYLDDLSGWCERAIHLQCAGGRDTLSLWNRGAKEVVGVDISDEMIECARAKTEMLNAPATWYRADVLDTPHELDGTADLVYTGRGALCWLHDLEGWAGVVARLLKPGGRLYLFDGHPMTYLFDEDAETLQVASHPWAIYVTDESFANQGWGENYIGDLGKPTEKTEWKYERTWRPGQVVTALARAGLRIAAMEEHAEPFYQEFSRLRPEESQRIAHTFSVLAFREPIDPEIRR